MLSPLHSACNNNYNNSFLWISYYLFFKEPTSSSNVIETFKKQKKLRNFKKKHLYYLTHYILLKGTQRTLSRLLFKLIMVWNEKGYVSNTQEAIPSWIINILIYDPNESEKKSCLLFSKGMFSPLCWLSIILDINSTIFCLKILNLSHKNKISILLVGVEWLNIQDKLLNLIRMCHMLICDHERKIMVESQKNILK